MQVERHISCRSGDATLLDKRNVFAGVWISKAYGERHSKTLLQLRSSDSLKMTPPPPPRKTTLGKPETQNMRSKTEPSQSTASTEFTKDYKVNNMLKSNDKKIRSKENQKIAAWNQLMRK